MSSATTPGRSLGLRKRRPMDIDRLLRKGLSGDALRRLGKFSQLSLETIGRVTRIPPRTLARRKIQGKLTAQESERLFRLAAVIEKAVDLFHGDKTEAMHWLQAPQKAFAGQTPLKLVETEIGAREVEDLMGKLAYGVFV